jgi:hypothetical protein
MNEAFLSIAAEQLESVEVLIYEVAEIPESAIAEYGTSGLEIFADAGTKYVAAAALRLDKLCSFAPNIPRECVQMLSYAFTLLTFLVYDDEFKTIDEKEFLSTLMTATHAAGMGEALLPWSPFSFEQANKRFLAAAGLKGAEVRNKPYGELKKWALSEAAKLRGSDKEISRKLANKIPAHMADISKEPARFFYEAIREERALKVTGSQPPVT